MDESLKEWIAPILSITNRLERLENKLEQLEELVQMSQKVERLEISRDKHRDRINELSTVYKALAMKSKLDESKFSQEIDDLKKTMASSTLDDAEKPDLLTDISPSVVNAKLDDIHRNLSGMTMINHQNLEMVNQNLEQVNKEIDLLKSCVLSSKTSIFTSAKPANTISRSVEQTIRIKYLEFKRKNPDVCDDKLLLRQFVLMLDRDLVPHNIEYEPFEVEEIFKNFFHSGATIGQTIKYFEERSAYDYNRKLAETSEGSVDNPEMQKMIALASDRPQLIVNAGVDEWLRTSFAEYMAKFPEEDPKTFLKLFAYLLDKWEIPHNIVYEPSEVKETLSNFFGGGTLKQTIRYLEQRSAMQSEPQVTKTEEK